jgi:hypothetical protein
MASYPNSIRHLSYPRETEVQQDQGMKLATLPMGVSDLQLIG